MFLANARGDHMDKAFEDWLQNYFIGSCERLHVFSMLLRSMLL